MTATPPMPAGSPRPVPPVPPAPTNNARPTGLDHAQHVLLERLQR